MRPASGKHGSPAGLSISLADPGTTRRPHTYKESTRPHEIIRFD